MRWNCKLLLRKMQHCHDSICTRVIMWLHYMLVWLYVHVCYVCKDIPMMEIPPFRSLKLMLCEVLLSLQHSLIDNLGPSLERNIWINKRERDTHNQIDKISSSISNTCDNFTNSYYKGERLLSWISCTIHKPVYKSQHNNNYQIWNMNNKDICH